MPLPSLARRLPLLLALFAPALGAQIPLPPEPATPPAMAPTGLHEPEGPRRLSGPRFGMTYLSADLIDRINETFGEGTYDPQTGEYTYEDRISSGLPLVTQFGWQWERSLFQASTGLTGVTEWVLLAGGLERGLFLPSATFLVGLRGPGGLEVGLGPNVSASGAAYALAVGFNAASGEVNVPVNVAAVLGQDGPRVSVLVGFVLSERRY